MKRFAYYILIIFGVLGLIDTISLLFYANMNVGTLLPGFAGVAFVTYASLKLWIYKDRPIIINFTLRRLVIICVSLFTISFLLVESLIIFNNTSQQNVKTGYLIILGAGLKGETVSLTLKERLDKGIEYLSQYPSTKVIVSGGKGPEELISEAEAMKRYLAARGIESDRIIQEDKSTSTMENFKFSKKILSGLQSNGMTKIMIVTNDFHMLRAKMLAQRNGFEAYGITCSTPMSVRLNSYAREYFALIKSYFFDR